MPKAELSHLSRPLLGYAGAICWRRNKTNTNIIIKITQRYEKPSSHSNARKSVYKCILTRDAYRNTSWMSEAMAISEFPVVMSFSVAYSTVVKYFVWCMSGCPVNWNLQIKIISPEWTRSTGRSEIEPFVKKIIKKERRAESSSL